MKTPKRSVPYKCLTFAFALFLFAVVAWAFCSAVSAATIYDLKTDWSDTNNPNGAWAYRQDGSTLPHNDVSVCCSPGSGINAAWAPGSVLGNFLPLWAKATANNTAAGFLAGDIIVHSVDNFNGNPASGEANVTWTAPVDGIIDISGSLWYAQFGEVRSNDFILTLNGTTLTTGTVSATNGRDRANPLTFSSTGLSVNAGDVLQLQVHRSPGQPFGSFAGVNLTITETGLCTPPVIIGASATPSVLWSPNHKFVDVTIDYTVTDHTCPNTSMLTVSSNELPVDDKTPEWIVLDAHHVQLRAERLGTGTGRIYTITIIGTNAAGTTTKSVAVVVPHDER